jgi:hypothetical protein
VSAQHSAPRQHANLATALAAAQRDVQALFKDGDNKHHDYPYTTSESLIDRGRAWLAEHGLAFEESTATLDLTTKPPMAHMRYRLSHETDSAINGATRDYEASWPVIEGKGRPLDKVFAGARTTALAYQLRGVLLIPRSDEIADMNQRDDRNHEPVRDERREEPRREEPANDTKPATSDVGFDALLESIREGGYDDIRIMYGKIQASLDGKAIGPVQSRILRFCAEAYEITSPEAFAALGADIRKSGLEKSHVNETLDLIEPAWLALQETKKAS